MKDESDLWEAMMGALDMAHECGQDYGRLPDGAARSRELNREWIDRFAKLQNAFIKMTGRNPNVQGWRHPKWTR